MSARPVMLLLVLVAPGLLGTFCVPSLDKIPPCTYAGQLDCYVVNLPYSGEQSIGIAGDAGVVFIDLDGGCSAPSDAGACSLCAEAECCGALSECPDAGTSCPALDDCVRVYCASLCVEVP